MMDTTFKYVCCQEIDKMSENDTEISCITNDEGFQPVCLNRWVSIFCVL